VQFLAGAGIGVRRAASHLHLWVSNSSSCCDRKLDQVSAVGDPSHVVQIGRRFRFDFVDLQNPQICSPPVGFEPIVAMGASA